MGPGGEERGPEAGILLSTSLTSAAGPFHLFSDVTARTAGWGAGRGGSDADKGNAKENNKQAYVRPTLAALEHLDALTLTYELPASLAGTP